MSVLVSRHCFFQAEDGIRDTSVTGVQTCALPIYEVHVGTFTPEGTWRAAAEKLPLLKEDGITLLEMMPIADFPGNFGWRSEERRVGKECSSWGGSCL